LYTVAAGKSAVISTILVCNQTSTSYPFRVAVVQNGTTPTSISWIYYDVQCLGNDSFASTIGITMAANDSIIVESGFANALSFNAFGDES
jgi:hypothetical protein